MGYTYWLHAHSFAVSFEPMPVQFFSIRLSCQYVDGLRSAIQIHPPKEVYSYDGEFTVVLGDWYHNSSVPLTLNSRS
jgi:FtsP/CotA-like multicopper oxidase with cupredoxin domain